MTHNFARRVLALLVACTMLFGLLAVCASAEDTDSEPVITLVNTAKGTLKQGDEFTVEVRFPMDFGFSNFELFFDFDLTQFKLKAVNTNHKINAGGKEYTVPYLLGEVASNSGTCEYEGKTYGGSVTTAFTGTSEEHNMYAEEGILFTLTFEVLKCAAAPQSITIHSIRFQKCLSVQTFEDIIPVIQPAEITISHTLTVVPAKDATCTEPGNSEYYVCSACGAKFSDADGSRAITDEAVVIPAKGHEWGNPTYTWDGYMPCTAERVCNTDSSHTETETATAASSVTKEATCTEEGSVTYTASFENTAFAGQTKTAPIPALGHDWGEWAVEDGVMTRHCTRCEETNTKGTAAVTFTAKSGPFTYDGSSHALSEFVDAATVSGDTSAITYLLDGTPATLDGTTVTDAGTYTVTAIYEDDTSYGAATVTFTIQPKIIAVSNWSWNTSAPFTYDGSTKTVALSTDNDGLELVDVTYGNAAETNAGTYTATASCTLKAGNEKNYQISGTVPSLDWSIAKAPVTPPTAAENLQYNGAEQTGVAAGTHYTVTGGTATDAGHYSATIRLNDNLNYRWSDSTGTGESDDRTISWSIAKAAAMSLTGNKSLLYSNTAEQTITAADVSSAADVMLTELTVSNSSNILAVSTLQDGSVTYALGNLSKDDTGKSATLTITFSSKNYEDSTYTLTITVMDKTDVSGNITFPDGSAAYTGVQQTYAAAQYNGQTSANFTYSYSADPIDAGTYTVTATYEDETSYGTKTAQFTITPAQLTVIGGTVAEKTYDGSTAAEVSDVTFSGLVNGETLTAPDYTVSNAAFDNANAGESKTVAFTVALADSAKNYTLGTTPNGSAQGTITPKSIAVEVCDVADQNYTGSALEPAVTVSATDTVDGYELVKDTDYIVSYSGNVNTGTACVTVSAKAGSNYAFETVSKNFTIQKGVLAVSAENLSVTYTGTVLDASAIRGTASFNEQPVTGAWSWVTEPGVTVNGSAYTATVKFTPDDTVNFDPVEKQITVTITKADPVGVPAYTRITTSGKTLADANLGLGTLPEGGTVVWTDADGNVLPDDTKVEANKSYTWRYTPDDTENYNVITGSVTLYTHSYRPVTPSKPSTPTKPTEPVNTVSFRDVAKSDWYYDAVQYVSEKGLMTGTGTNRFSPDATTTRGMIVTILARLEGVDTAKGSIWYEAGQKWAMENGISDGTNMTGEITREQLAAILYRYAKYNGYDVNKSNDLSRFTDSDKVSDWALTAMRWANAESLITGKGNLLDPQGKATRAETAAILMRFMQNVAEFDD